MVMISFPHPGSCLGHTAVLYQGRSSTVLLGAVIRWFQVTTVQPLESYSEKHLWQDWTVQLWCHQLKWWHGVFLGGFFAYFCNSEEPLDQLFGKRYTAKLKGKYQLTVAISWFQYETCWLDFRDTLFTACCTFTLTWWGRLLCMRLRCMSWEVVLLGATSWCKTFGASLVSGIFLFFPVFPHSHLLHC